MRRIATAVTFCLPVMGVATVEAQDLFDSTNTATRSYNFVELQYITDMDVDLPLLANISVAVTDSISFVGVYTKTDVDVDDDDTDGITLDAGVESFGIGLEYHNTFNYFSDTDWVAGLIVGQARIDLSASAVDEFGQDIGIQIEDTSSFQQASLGLRRTLTAKFEGEAGLSLFRTSDDSEVTGFAQVVYRLIPAVDIAISLTDITEQDLVGIGLRYTW